MSTRWSPFVKQLVVIGSVVAAVWLLGRVSVLFTPVILALLLAYLTSFPTMWIIRQTGWSRGPVVAFIYLLVVVILIVAPVIFLPRFMGLFRGLYFSLRHVVTALTETAPQPIEITPTWTLDLGPFYAPLNQWLTSLIQPDPGVPPTWQSFLFPFAGRAVTVVRGAVTSVAWTIVTLAVSFYVAKDAPSMGRFIASRVHESLQPELDRLWRELVVIWDAYIRGQIILGVMMGVITWVVMTVLGVRNAPALGLLYFLAEFVPGIGHVIAAAVGIALALSFGSTWVPLIHLWFAFLVAVVYFLLAQFENVYLLPRIIGRHIALHPVVIMVGALAGAHIGGVLGILLAAPIIASIRLFFGYAVRKLLDDNPFPPKVAPGREHDAYWLALLRDRPVGALLFDLDGTLVEADDVLVNRLAARLAPLQRYFSSFPAQQAARRLLMVADVIVNELVSLLNQFHLQRPLVRLNDRLRRVRGHAAPDHYVPLPGSVEVLQALGKRYPLGLLTGRNAYDAAAYLAQFGLAGLFQTVITRDDVRQLKPHPAAIKLAARRLGVAPGLCLVAGDTPVDVQAAKSAGALAVGVLSGFGSPKDLNGADLIISSVTELERWLPVAQQPPLQAWEAFAETAANDLGPNALQKEAPPV